MLAAAGVRSRRDAAASRWPWPRGRQHSVRHPHRTRRLDDGRDATGELRPVAGKSARAGSSRIERGWPEQFGVDLTWTPDQMPNFTDSRERRLFAGNRSERAPARHGYPGAARAEARFAARSGRDAGDRPRREAGGKLEDVTSSFVRSPFRNASVALVILLFAVSARAATDHFGRVTFGGLPVPGASITATHDEQKASTVTNQDGILRLAALTDGTWIVRVEMPGFAPASRGGRDCRRNDNIDVAAADAAARRDDARRAVRREGQSPG